MLALGYLHVTFLLKLRSHLAKSELLQTTKIKDNKLHSVFVKEITLKFILKSPSQPEITLHLILYYYP